MGKPGRPAKKTDVTPLAHSTPEEAARNIFAAVKPPDPSKRRKKQEKRPKPG